MPMYEYACEACGNQLEAHQKMSDDPLTLCPACHQERLVRLISSSSFSLKGAGWYADGYTGGSPEKSSKPAKKTDKSSKPSDSAAA